MELYLGLEQFARSRSAVPSMASTANQGVAAGADKHAGLEGKTSLECCDASMPVLSVWECLNTFLSSAAGKPRALLPSDRSHAAKMACNQSFCASNFASSALGLAYYAM